jgi:hypothetical protein
MTLLGEDQLLCLPNKSFGKLANETAGLPETCAAAREDDSESLVAKVRLSWTLEPLNSWQQEQNTHFGRY